MQPMQPTPWFLQPQLDGSATRVAGLDLAAGRGHTALAIVALGRADELPLWQRTTESAPLVTDADIVAAIAVAAARYPAARNLPCTCA